MYEDLPHYKPKIPALLIGYKEGVILMTNEYSPVPQVNIRFSNIQLERLKVQVWTSSDLEFFDKFLASLGKYIYHIYKYVDVEPRFFTA